jgi:hypothetical protein
VIVREFWVREGYRKDFELVFSPDGLWPGLLQPRSEGFLGTVLHAFAGNRYQVRDCWKSHLDFEDFRERHQYDVEQFQKWLAGKELVEQETLLGAFYSDDPDDGEDAGLVPA